jgi:uncharacterized protein with PIN domain
MLMFKTEADIEINRKQRVRTQENMQVIMHRLQTLDGKISKLICQCEELRKTAIENKDKGRLCSQCGNEIEAGQEAIIRDLVGTEIGRYHKECLQELLKWKES